MPETRNRLIVNSIDSPAHRRAATFGARHGCPVVGSRRS